MIHQSDSWDIFSNKQILDADKDIYNYNLKKSTTWNFAHGITRVSTNELDLYEHCLCTQSLLKTKFLNNSGLFR